MEPRIPLLRRDLKVAACMNIDSYFRLGNNLVKAKKLMEQHAYIYALRFDVSTVIVCSSLDISLSYSLLHTSIIVVSTSQASN